MWEGYCWVETMHNIRRALHRYRAPFIGVALFLCLFSFAVYANYLDTITEEDTIHILPLSVIETGWSNIETLYVQDLNEAALYEDFNRQNAAYLRVSEASLVPPVTVEEVSSSTTEGTLVPTYSTDEELPQPTTADGQGAPEVSVPDESGVSTPEPVAPSEEVVPPAPEAAAEVEVLTPPPDPVSDAPLLDVVSAESSVSLFARVRERLSLAFADVVETSEAPQPQTNTPEVGGADTASVSSSVVDSEPTQPEPADNASGVDPDVATTTVVEDVPIPIVHDDIAQNAAHEATTTVLEAAPAVGPAITWNGFSLPALADTETIQNAQIRMSLAAQSSRTAKERGVSAAIRVQYAFLDEVWVDAGIITIEDEVSNAINGGFYLFALPPIIDPLMLRSLKVRAVYEGARADVDEVLIDSAWIELSARTLNRAALEARVSPEALTELEKPAMHDLVSKEIDFTEDELPNFALKYNEQRSLPVQLARKVFSSNTATLEHVAIIHRDVGELPIVPSINQTSDGLWSIQIPETERDELRPGEYTLEITVAEGSKVFVDRLEFQWGLLAINTDKNEYARGEQVAVSMAALSPNGNTLCEAPLELYVINEQNFIRRLPVASSGVCNGNNVVDVPDYSASLGAMATGTYELYLEHIEQETGRALAHTKTTFTVVDTHDLSLARSGPTRIYPVEPYEMRIVVAASTSFDGVLTETIPTDYTVLETEGEVQGDGDAQRITFPVSIRAGESQTFTYRFDSPDISPLLYQLGPATLSGVRAVQTPLASLEAGTTTLSEVPAVSQQDVVFREHKQWQIASDATGSMIIYMATSSHPSGWTCLSCSGGDTFFQKFVRGGITYGTASGTATHTHTADGSVNAATAGSSENRAGANVAIVSHSHSLTPTITSTSSLPAYRDLRMYQSNSAGEPASIPSGAVFAFDTTPPVGWTAISVLNGRYPRGESTSTTTGGSNTHLHTVSGTTGAAAGTILDGRTGGTQVTPKPATNNHTHTVSTSTALVSQEPPYIDVIYASTTGATSTPVGALTMWTDTPPAGWLHQSADASDPFYNRFLRGAATYGASGGTETHTHSSMSGITTSAPSALVANARTGSTGASGTHTHQVDVTNFSTNSHLPPYVTAIIARKYGAVAIYTQTSFKWFANTDAATPTDPWPLGVEDLIEAEPITATSTTLRYEDQIRLRLGVGVENSTSTADTFKLQFASTTEDNLCTVLTNWNDVGSATSSVVWKGYDNTSVADGVTLSSSTLVRTDRLETYEESNPTATTPNQIGIAEDGEWDFSLQQNGAEAGMDYCFRMVKSDGSPLFAYDYYPRLTVNDDAAQFTLNKPFDNERISTTTPNFEFSGTDGESDSLTYQVQVDDDYTFVSTAIDANSETNSTLFSNITTPADKDPFTNGETVRFRSSTALSNGTTYYWRVRARDTGSNQYSDWSGIYSFTLDTNATTTSAWYQTMRDQFRSDVLQGVEATSTGQLQLIVGSTTGTTTSGEITFAKGVLGNAWGSLSWNDNEAAGDIKYRIQYEVSDDVWENIPDSDLVGNSTGFDTSPQSLLSLDADEYPVIRIEAVFTNTGGTPILNDWTLSWGYKINTPSITKLFPSEKTATTTPTFEFTTTDPQNDDLTYEVQWSTSYTFTSSTTRSSDINLGFSNITNPIDTQPFTSGHTIQYKVQVADILSNGTTYWWRVRARDPGGANTYSNYTDAQSFTVDTSVSVSTWFQTTTEQFAIDTIIGATTTGNSVTVATSAVESLTVYAEGNIQTPRYRTWNGSIWSTEQSAPTVGAAMNFVVTRAAPTREEYLTATVGTDQDVNLLVFSEGAWGNQLELTTSLADAGMRGVDIAYETSSGDAMVVSCDGDADPSYWIWNGATTTLGGTINVDAVANCGFIRLISDPTSDEIIAVVRSVTGAEYEAQVWNGSSWGNATRSGQMQATQSAHEGMTGAYEEGGGQAVVAVSNNTAASFVSMVWNGTTWSSTTEAIGNDFEFGDMASDVGTDNMALCYIDADSDIGYIRWTGAAWTGQAELDTNGNSLDGRALDCEYRVGGSFDGNLMMVYSDTTAVRYRYYNGALQPATEGTVTTLQDAYTVQLARTGAGVLQVMTYDDVNDRYDYSTLTAATTTWSTLQTLEADASVGAAPFKEPFMMAARKPGSSATVVAYPTLDWNDGSGPYWQSFSWNDSEPGLSTLRYQVEYYDGDSWELVPNGLIPGNSSGTSTSPVSLTNVLPVASTYNQLRTVANLVCNTGSCPTLNDWTLTWAAGINISGTAQEYNQSTNLVAGNVAVALNGVLQIGKTGTISGGTWS
ncbi:MAG: hypothetical protein RLZZ234_786, partial [Candidatus Parcubacteria bacterium]